MMVFCFVLVKPRTPAGKKIMSEIAAELERCRICFDWVVPEYDKVSNCVWEFIQFNKSLREVIVVYESRCDDEDDRTVEKIVKNMAKATVWAFSGARCLEGQRERFRYFLDVYPDHLKEKSGLEEILAAISEIREKKN